MRGTTRQQHKIRQVLFDVQYLDAREALEAPNRLQQLFNRTIAPALEELFDRHVDSHLLLRIDHLEINLGAVGRLDEEVILQAVRRQVIEQLRQLERPVADEAATAAECEEVFMTFLNSGAWPWHATYGSIAELETALQRLPPSRLARLAADLRKLLQQPPARVRLCQQFSPVCVQWLITQLYGEMAITPLTLAAALRPRLAWAEALQVVLEAVELTTSLPDKQPLSAASWKRIVRELAVGQHGRRIRARDVKHVNGNAQHSRPSSTDTQIVGPDPDPELQAYYVSGAGIVLLHPFLERFFESLSLLDERGRLDAPDCRARAVHLLYYLASGGEQPYEYLTTLFKVLCGMSPEAVVIKDLQLSASERDEAEHLLHSVIGHWSKLKSTSPAGLREAFLEREGKLDHHARGWKLIVEQRAVDVLLQYLPWGLSIIRLPWMDEPLWVDWA